MNEMKNEDCKKILELLTRDAILDREKAESIVHAFVDIEHSLNEVYNKILPELIQTGEFRQEQILEKLWEIREQFRHIDYHIHDANLTDL